MSSGCDKTPKPFKIKRLTELHCLLQLFHFSTLYAKIDLAGVKVLINEVFACVLNTHHLKFLLGQRVALNFRFLWLKN